MKKINMIAAAAIAVIVLGTGGYLLVAKNAGRLPNGQTAGIVPTTPTTDLCGVSSFTADATTIAKGGSVKLSWNIVSGCDHATLDDGNVAFVVTGKSFGPLVASHTYVLTAYDKHGQKVSFPLLISVAGTPIVTQPGCDIDTSSVTVVSPNGGDLYVPGQTINVKWKTCTIPATAKITLALAYNGGQNGISAGNVSLRSPTGATQFANTGSADVVLPTDAQLIASNWMAGTYYKVVGVVQGAQYANPAIQDQSDALFTVATLTPVKASCTIDSFTLPTTTKLSSATLTASIKTSNCSNVFARINTGSYEQGYENLPTNGTYTFATQAYPTTSSHDTYSKTDNTLDVTLFASNSIGMTSVTNSVTLSDITASGDQCVITSVSVTPNPVVKGQKVTLSWKAPSGCFVSVARFTGDANYVNIKDPKVFEFNGTDSYSEVLSVPSTYYLYAQTITDLIHNVNNFNVNISAKAVSVSVK